MVPGRSCASHGGSPSSHPGATGGDRPEVHERATPVPDRGVEWAPPRSPAVISRSPTCVRAGPADAAGHRSTLGAGCSRPSKWGRRCRSRCPMTVPPLDAAAGSGRGRSTRSRPGEAASVPWSDGAGQADAQCVVVPLAGRWSLRGACYAGRHGRRSVVHSAVRRRHYPLRVAIATAGHNTLAFYGTRMA